MRTLPLSFSLSRSEGRSEFHAPLHALEGSSRSASTSERVVSITLHRRIKPGFERKFNEALNAFTQFAVLCPGHLDCHVLQRRQGKQDECAIVNRFSNAQVRQAFTGSPPFKIWLGHLRAFTEEIRPRTEAAAVPLPTVVSETVAPKARARGLVGASIFFCLFALAFVLPTIACFIFSGWHPSPRDGIAATLFVAALVLVSLFLAFKDRAGEDVASD